MQRYMRNASHIIVECAQTLSTDNDLLFQPLVKGFETCYLSTCALNQGSFFFLLMFIVVNVLVNYYNLLRSEKELPKV